MARIAYQLYSAREEAARDLGAVLREVARLGYDGVEFAGFYGKSAAEIDELLYKNNLVAASSHVPYEEILKNRFGVISYHAAIGCPRIAVPYLEEGFRPGRPAFASVIAEIHRFGQWCREAGIGLIYHNHDFEFVELSGGHALNFLYEAVPSNLLQTEIDTCWVRYAGLDPVAYVSKYAGRCPVVHLKDYSCDEPTAPLTPRPASFRFRALGRGCQDIEKIVRASIASGAEWLVVEQDFPETTPFEDAKVSIEAIRAVL